MRPDLLDFRIFDKRPIFRISLIYLCIKLLRRFALTSIFRNGHDFTTKMAKDQGIKIPSTVGTGGTQGAICPQKNSFLISRLENVRGAPS